MISGCELISHRECDVCGQTNRRALLVADVGYHRTSEPHKEDDGDDNSRGCVVTYNIGEHRANAKVEYLSENGGGYEQS